MIITKKKHLEQITAKDKEIDFLIEEKRKLELVVNQVYRIWKRWKKKEIGNLKAISSISELFREAE